MNRADRRRAQKFARSLGRLRQDHGDPGWRCSYCDQQAGTVIEVCMEGCCEPQQRCASCGLPSL